MKKPPPRPVPAETTKRCAIYTRKSTSAGLEKDFNSLDAQREACEAYIRRQPGWTLVDRRYDDGGFTGANTDRPAFQQLLADVDDGTIDIIVVYKVDRLSRSLLDFAKLVERFDKAGAAFVSVTQSFSTADPMGKLTLNILMSFAEFEREMIAARTRDKVQAARKKGKWTGGPTPLGYRVEKGRLLLDEVEAPQVRAIYEMYLEHRSFVRILDVLAERGWTTKFHGEREGKIRNGRSWTKDALIRVLKNPTYTGQIRSNEGMVTGEHEAIISQETFDQVQHAMGSKNRPWVKRGSEIFLLRGLICCGQCGRTMTPVTSRRARSLYRYYRCETAAKKGNVCRTRPMPAGPIEDVVLEQIRLRARTGELAREVTAALQERTRQALVTWDEERQRLPHEIARLSAESTNLLEALGQSSEVTRRLIDTRLREVTTLLEAKEKRLSTLEAEKARLEGDRQETGWVVELLSDLDQLWEVLTPVNRERLMARLLEVVTVDQRTGQLHIAFRAGVPLTEFASPGASSLQEAV